MFKNIIAVVSVLVLFGSFVPVNAWTETTAACYITSIEVWGSGLSANNFPGGINIALDNKNTYAIYPNNPYLERMLAILNTAQNAKEQAVISYDYDTNGSKNGHDTYRVLRHGPGGPWHSALTSAYNQRGASPLRAYALRPVINCNCVTVR